MRNSLLLLANWPGANAAWYPAKPLPGVYAAPGMEGLEEQVASAALSR